MLVGVTVNMWIKYPQGTFGSVFHLVNHHRDVRLPTEAFEYPARVNKRTIADVRKRYCCLIKDNYSDFRNHFRAREIVPYARIFDVNGELTFEVKQTQF